MWIYDSKSSSSAVMEEFIMWMEFLCEWLIQTPQGGLVGRRLADMEA